MALLDIPPDRGRTGGDTVEFVKLKPINRICPSCGNGNYMRIISGKNIGKLNVKCINCNSYYNYDELLKRDNSKPLNGADGRTMDVQMLIDYIGSLDSETDEQIIERFRQAKADSADSWILDGDCWRANDE